MNAQSTSRNSVLWDALVLAFLALLWGSSFTSLRAVVPSLGAPEVVFLRLFFASVGVMVICIFQIGPKICLQHLKRVGIHWGLVGLTNFAIPFLGFAYASQGIPSGMSAILNGTAPLFGGLFSGLLLGSYPKPLQWLGMGIGFCGVAWMATAKIHLGDAQLPFAALALMSACGYGFSTNYLKKYVKNVPVLLTTGACQFFAMLWVGVLGRMVGLTTHPLLESVQQIGWVEFLNLANLGFLCGAFAFYVLYKMMERRSASFVLSTAFMIPIFGALLGAIVFHEVLGLRVISGALMVLVGVYIFVRPASAKTKV